jgi:hypothetical protein
VSSTEVIQRVVAPALQEEIPMMAALASSPDLSVGEEGLQADLDMAVGADASSLDPKVARILLEAVAATWEVHQLQEILPTTSRVPGYSKKPVTQKRSSHACLIIEIQSCVGSMDHPVWWDEKTAVVMHRMECT